MSHYFKNLTSLTKKPELASLILYLLIVVFIFLFSYLSVAEHLGLKSNMNDLGGIDQALYATTKGSPFHNSSFFIAEGKTNPTFLAKHAFFTLVAFVPFYFVGPNPNILLIIQSIFVGLGALPLFWLGKNIFKNRIWMPLITPLAYLTSPIIHEAILQDFHDITLALPLIIFAFYFLYMKNYLLFYLFAVFIALTKEDLPLTVLAFGLYLFLIQKDKFRGLAISLLSLFYFYIAVDKLMPYFAGTNTLPLVNARYSHLGDNGLEIVKNLVFKPWIALSTVLVPFKVLYLVLLLLPLGFVPLMSLSQLILIIPALTINLLSSNLTMSYPFEYYYSTVVVAGLIIATVFSLKKVETIKTKSVLIQNANNLVLISSLVSFFLLSPAPLSLVSSWREFEVSEHAKNIFKVQKIIEKSASVSVQNNLGPHLSQRFEIYTFPYKFDQTDYVVLDVSDPNPIIRRFPRRRSFELNIIMPLQNYYEKINELFKNENYGVIYFSDDGYLVFRKNYPREKNDQAERVFLKNFKSINDKYKQFGLGANIY